MTSKRLSPLDSMFLAAESPETMMHVAGLMQFRPTSGDAGDILDQLRDEIYGSNEIEPPWNMKLQTPWFLLNPLQRWVEDPKFDVMYHVRRSALPRPGDQRELGILISRLHARQLDLTRPPWELHIIEGLDDGNVALYVKMHHSLVDGYTAMKTLIRSMSTDPSDTDTPLFFRNPVPKRERRKDEKDSGLIPDIGGLLRSVTSELSTVIDLPAAFVKLAVTAVSSSNPLVGPGQAPHTIFNGRIGRSRRFATQQYDIARLRAVADAAGATLNDVALAICGGGLRDYLLGLDALPEKSLIAMLPVNIRPKDDPGGGNAVGAILATLGTDLADARERIEAISASTKAAKEQLSGMTSTAILAYTAALMAPFLVQTGAATLGAPKVAPASYNVILSNVPGPDYPLYFRGNELVSTYPVSIPVHGVGLNITCQSYSGTLNFGFTGCRDSMPHMQKLAIKTGEALVALEHAYGLL
ncbi:wax ester/triacylglycerol synthase family O-acyltransferase [Mycolicibacterium mucogenicum]|uniref:WS/DGAT/MGAT family O-acyltransferase n=1 Tax=Mycolicibacterium mucogenicum TaxID=56689 RepID=UPI00226A01E8|nr:wax ester/triacylglycerol synthase family O-acyltransferase [Mycolicibacterium mucogenicum]MCX8562038.1 wax ester/triacylglycerol synthase family O-acyltransferase [Mycolicibacterium mucogenicum]